MNRPDSSMAEEVIQFVLEAPYLQVLHMLGEQGFTHLRVVYTKKKSKKVLK